MGEQRDSYPCESPPERMKGLFTVETSFQQPPPLGYVSIEIVDAARRNQVRRYLLIFAIGCVWGLGVMWWWMR